MIRVRSALVAVWMAAPLSAFAQSQSQTQTPPQQPQPPAETPGVEAPLRYRFSGYLRLEGTVVQNDPDVAFIGRNDGFTLANARVAVAGTWRDRIAFKISADGAEDEREDANATEGTLRFALKDAWADFKLARAATIRGGQFYPLFDLEEITGQDEMWFVDRALESRGTRATEGWESQGLGAGRSIGVAVRAPRALGNDSIALGYEVVAQNGNGENESANDNDTLAYGASLFLSLPRDSVIAVSGRHNRRTEGDLPFRQVEEDVSGAASAQIEVGPARVAGQVIGRSTTFPSTGGPSENALGAHAQAMFRIVAGKMAVEPGYRFAMLDPSDLITTDLVQEHTVGVNLLIPDARARLQLNFTHSVEQAGRALDNDRAELMLQVGL